jgi:uncharacterized membrane protein YqjE
VRDKKGLFSFLNIDSIMDNLMGFVEKKIELFKIEFKEEAARAGAKIVILFILSMAMFMAIFFITVGLSNLLNNLLNSTFLGYFIMAGVYLFVMIIFIFLNKSFGINKHLEDMFLKILNSNSKE